MLTSAPAKGIRYHREDGTGACCFVVQFRVEGDADWREERTVDGDGILRTHRRAISAASTLRAFGAAARIVRQAAPEEVPSC